MAPSRATLSHLLALLPPRRIPPNHPRTFLALRLLPLPQPTQPHRLLTTPASTPAAHPHDSPTLTPPDYLNANELAVFEKLRRELQPEKLEVQDISGGCGSMYAIEIESTRFAGLSVMRQHRLVNGVLADEIARWHGVQLRTRAR